MALPESVGLRGPLSVLDPDDVAALLAMGRRCRYQTGEALLRQGEEADAVLVLEAGRVSVVRTTPGGQEVLVALRGPGDTLGELAVLDPAPRLATVTALEPVAALSVPAPAFLDFVMARPVLVGAFLRLLVRRLRESDRLLVEGRAQDTRTRLARHLMELGARFGRAADDGLLLDVPLSQEQLASWVGASREATNIALRRLREEGAVATRRMRITILDVDALRTAAAG